MRRGWKDYSAQLDGFLTFVTHCKVFLSYEMAGKRTNDTFVLRVPSSNFSYIK
jgi:hypothetical protein